MVDTYLGTFQDTNANGVGPPLEPGWHENFMQKMDPVRLLLTDETARQQAADILSTADTQVQNTGLSSSAGLAISRATGEYIKNVKDLTGVQLENPYDGGYQQQAIDRLAEMQKHQLDQQPVDGLGYVSPLNDWPAISQIQMDIWNENLRKVQRENREVAQQLQYNPVDLARGLIERNLAAAQRANTGGPLNDRFKGVLRFAGGAAAGRYDPLQVGSLFLGGGAADLLYSGSSVALRIGAESLTQAAINTGVTAMTMPVVNDWARTTMQPGMSAADLGYSALFGAVGGAFGGALGEAFRARSGSVAKILNGEAAPSTVRETLDALNLSPSGDVAKVLDQAVQGELADRVIANDRPPGVDQASHADAVQQRINTTVNRDVPAPETPDLLPERPADTIPSDRDGAPNPQLGHVLTRDGKPVTYQAFDTGKLTADPAAFQYKSNGDSQGVTERLRGVNTWDRQAAGNALVYERADGTLVIADGHQRLGLARRIAAAGGEQPVINGYLYKAADGWTEADVRAYAALKNMQEGSGTPLDAARVLRDRPDLVTDALPVSTPGMKQALGLSKLSPEAWGMVLNGVVPENFAAAVGQLVPDPTLHAPIMDELSSGRPQNEQQARFMISDMLAAGFSQQETIDLFGSSPVTKTLFGERAAVTDAANRLLRDDAKLFGTLADRADIIEASGGNKLDTSNNQARADSANTIIELINRLARSVGPVSDMLNQAARSVAEAGVKPKAAARQFIADFKAVLDRDGLRTLMTAPSLETPLPKSVLEAVDRDLETADMFAGEGGGGQPAPTASQPAAEIKPTVDPEVVAQQLGAMKERQKGLTVEQLHAKASEFQAELLQTGQAIADELGIQFKSAKVKELPKAIEKLTRKNYDGPHQLTDLARAAFVVDTPEQGDAVVKALKERYGGVDEGWATNDTLYSDRKFSVQAPNGVVAEIQIMPRPMYKAKFEDKMGKVYDATRSMPPGPERDALRKPMLDAYRLAAEDPVWRSIFDTSKSPKDLNVLRQTASGMSEAVPQTSGPSTLDQGAPGRSTAYASSGEKATAGRQSQLENFTGGTSTVDISAAAKSTPVTKAPEGPLWDSVPIGAPEDGAGVTMASMEDASAVLDRMEHQANIIDLCTMG